MGMVGYVNRWIDMNGDDPHNGIDHVSVKISIYLFLLIGTFISSHNIIICLLIGPNNWQLCHLCHLEEEEEGEGEGEVFLLPCVRVSPVALRFGSKMDPCRRDLTNILLSYLVSDSFRPVLGARAWSCKTANDYLSLSQLRNTSETFRERCLSLPPGLSVFYITFLLYDLMGLTILDHIYSSFL